MNCDTCQRRLLAAENPAAPPAPVQAHLDGCPACRRRQRQLLRVERHVHRLPVPPSRGKAEFLREFVGRPAAARPAPQSVPWWRRRLTGRLVGATAAAVLIAAGIYLGVMVSRSPSRSDAPQTRAPEPEPPAQDLVARLLDCDVRLAEANTPVERVRALADAADALHRESRTLTRADGGKELQTLAALYESVIQDGVVRRAQAVPAAERREVLGEIAKELTRQGQEAGQLAKRSEAAAEPLRRIAEAARSADRRLHELMEEEAP